MALNCTLQSMKSLNWDTALKKGHKEGKKKTVAPPLLLLIFLFSPVRRELFDGGFGHLKVLWSGLF